MTYDGLYIITGDMKKDNNAKLIAFVAKDVEAKGVVSVKNNDKWVELASIVLAKK